MSGDTSEPVNVNSLALLAGDVLATRAKALIDQFAAGDWKPLADLKAAVSTYSEVRLGSTIADSQPPEPLPTCEGCKHRDQCEGIPAADRDCLRGRRRSCTQFNWGAGTS